MKRIKQQCSTCRFSRLRVDKKLECHRHPPLPYSAMVFYLAELFRDIAWSQHSLSGAATPEESDDLNREATEAADYACWPEVERDEWCGEWEKKR